MRQVIVLATIVLTSIIANAQLPSMVQDIAPGTAFGGPLGMLTWQGKMYFVATDAIHGYELWSYDENSPAQMVFDFNPGAANGIAAIGVYKDKLFFSGDNGSGYEVYSYDGSNPPVKLTSIWPNANTGPPYEFTVAGNILFFSASHFRPNAQYPTLTRDLFSYDGTDTPKYYTPSPSSNFGLMPEWFITYNNKLYFAGTTLTYQGISQLHELDPSTGNIQILHDLPGTTDKAYSFYTPVVLGNKLYFTAYHIQHLTTTGADHTTDGCELHSWDGNTIQQLTNLGPGTYPGVMARVGTYRGAIYFGGLDTGGTYQLFCFDPTTATIRLACVVNPIKTAEGMIDEMIEYGSKLYFISYTRSTGHELWQYDDETCGILMDIFPGPGSGVSSGASFHIYNGHLYFSANDSIHGRELWRIEGTTGIKNVIWNGTVSAYPNPTKTNAILEITLAEVQSLLISVVDANGRCLFKAPLQNATSGKTKALIPMQGWVSGMYFYKISDIDGRGLASGRIIRQ